MPRDKAVLAIQVAIGAYVVYQVGTTVYNHLKAKDRLKRNERLPSENTHSLSLSLFSSQTALQRQRQLIVCIVRPFSTIY